MSKIEWTEKTWNVSTGCNKVSEGCKHCYAAVMHPRQMVLNPEKYAHPFLDGAFPHEASLEMPLRRKKPAMIFVNSMSDLFHENIPFEFIDKVFAVMALCPQHTFQILTKRPERLSEYFNNYLYSTERAKKYIAQSVEDTPLGDFIFDRFTGLNPVPCQPDAAAFIFEAVQVWPLPNVWIGTSVENQEQADKRIPYLLQIPAAVRFLSCEPLLGEVDLTSIQCDRAYGSYLFNALTGKGRTHLNTPFSSTLDMNKLHWVIVGGESGHGARPMHPDWARKIRDDCQAAGVAFFFKQWGEYQLWDNVGTDYKESATGYQTSAGFKKPIAVYKDGFVSTTQFVRDFEPCAVAIKLGKKHTGRLLDGVEYGEYPNNERKK